MLLPPGSWDLHGGKTPASCALTSSYMYIHDMCVYIHLQISKKNIVITSSCKELYGMEQIGNESFSFSISSRIEFQGHVLASSSLVKAKEISKLSWDFSFSNQQFLF